MASTVALVSGGLVLLPAEAGTSALSDAESMAWGPYFFLLSLHFSLFPFHPFLVLFLSLAPCFPPAPLAPSQVQRPSGQWRTSVFVSSALSGGRLLEPPPDANFEISLRLRSE